MQQEDSRRSSKIDKCYECSSTNLIHDYDTGETICGGCGLVLYEQMMDKGPEWRGFTLEEKASRSRVGSPESYTVHDKGLSTTIFQIDRDAYGKKLPLSTRLQMWRLRKWQIRTRVHSSKDRNLAQAMDYITRLSEKIYAPQPIKEKAAITYRKVLDKGLVRGRSISAMSAASLYEAFRGSGNPRSLKEIAEASKEITHNLIGKKDIARCYRLLIKELEKNKSVENPINCASQIAEKVGISGESVGVAVQIIHQAREEKKTAGKGPWGLAAAALYIGCLKTGEKKVQRDIAKAAGVTEVTIRNRYKTLKEELKLEVPNKYEIK